MQIYYGTFEKYIDITQICKDKFMIDNQINIPHYDKIRKYFFGNPNPNNENQKIIIKDRNEIKAFDNNHRVEFNLNDNSYCAININYIHSKLNIKHGTLIEELPEQLMTFSILNKKNKVLEIGGNIGRNSLIIASLLENDKNLVVLECDTKISKQLEENKQLNNFNFHIENAALSKRKLIQKEWITIPSDTLIDGYNFVNNIITFDELNKKYNIAFDTLILDCEGAFYYILLDMPEILDNIKLIIMENDYTDIKEKEYVDKILIKNNFYRCYVEALGYGEMVCEKCFFEIWKK